MANKFQRKINKVLREFNKSFKKDIYPYNQFSLCQFKRVESREFAFENMYLIHLCQGKKIIATKWFEYYEIVGLGKQFTGRQFFWWLNNTIAKEVNKDK